MRAGEVDDRAVAVGWRVVWWWLEGDNAHRPTDCHCGDFDSALSAFRHERNRRMELPRRVTLVTPGGWVKRSYTGMGA